MLISHFPKFPNLPFQYPFGLIVAERFVDYLNQVTHIHPLSYTPRVTSITQGL